MWTCARCEQPVDNSLASCPACGARRYRALRWMSGAIRVIGCLGAVWLVVFFVILLGEVEEWRNLLPFAGAMIAMTGLCLGTFSIAELLKLAIHIAADVHAQQR